MFIVFEGIDGCGKSSISKKLSEEIGFEWSKEPTFSSEEADALNLKSKNDIQREIEFTIDRIKHLSSFINKHENIICDRYIWTGLAYCLTYNPAAYPFAESLYKHKYFTKPDYYVYIDAPVELCYSRRKTQPIEHLKKIKQAYMTSRPVIESDSKVIMTEGAGSIEDCVFEIKRILGL